MGYTTDLADFAARTTFRDLPDSVVETAKIVFFDTLMCGVAAQDFERDVQSFLRQIHGHVLPEIGELQGGAGEVRELLAFGVAVPA